MPQATITFPASSSPGRLIRNASFGSDTPTHRVEQESGGRLINAFAEKAPVGAPSPIIIRRSAGLRRLFGASGKTITRGFLDIGTLGMLWIVGDGVYYIADPKGSPSAVLAGTLSGTKAITTARNNAVTPNNVAVTENGCFNIFHNSAPTAFADADLPSDPDPSSVCIFNGYFIWSYPDGRIFASDLNAVTVNALSFTMEQGLNVRRVVNYGGRLFAMGDKWIGVYRDAGTSPFPLAKEVVIAKGLIGTHAVAGFDVGWANKLIWVGDDCIVYKLEGYTPVPISTPPVSYNIQQSLIADDSDRDYFEAFTYVVGLNSFWVITYRNEWTWEYNLTTGEWNERKSINRPDWVALKSLFKGDRWFLGAVSTGTCYQIDEQSYRDGTDLQVMEIESGVLQDFPRGTVISRASFNCSMGASNIEPLFDESLEPKVQISWSLDGGYSWGAPVLRKLGRPGETKSHPYVLNSGLSRGQGIRYKLLVSDPIHFALWGATAEVVNRRGFSG